MSLTLRPYQVEACDAAFGWWSDHTGNPLIVLPTGTGKSLVLAELSRRALSYGGVKILVIAHVRELIRQNYDEIREMWPEAPCGVYSAGLKRREHRDDITFCSIQSVHNKATLFQKVDLVFVDEAHLIPFEQQTMYRRFLLDLMIINPYLKVVGLTATPYRLSGGRLDTGDDRMFEGICYDYSIRTAIEEGYLCPPTSKPTEAMLDTTGVGTRAGDFAPGQLERAVNVEDDNELVVAETIRTMVAEDRKSVLFFCAGVKHAMAISAKVNARGVSCAVITAETPAAERDDIIEAFKAGKISALASMNVLTTGFNAKQVDLIALLRPTKSASLYVQMVGRGTRLWPGKVNCRVMDFAGNIYRFGPIDSINIRDPIKSEGDAPYKICPQCEEICHAAATECKACGFIFPVKEKELARKAAALPIISTEAPPPPPLWSRVTDIAYAAHNKPGKPTSLKVTYTCGLSRHSKWVCLEHSGYARDSARAWWIANGGENPIPETTAEALLRQGELRVPAEIRLGDDGKYVSVVAARGVSDVPRAGGPVVRLSPSLRDQCGF